MTVRIVIVGASRGLGRCIGVGLARKGHDVALLARDAERLERAAEEAGPNATALVCDVTDEASCHKAISGAASELGGIDVLVYTPGIGPLVRLVETDAVTWRSVLDTNVVGAALVTAAALPHLESSGGRALYLTSVSAAGTPWPGLGAYATSKAALEKMVEGWGAEHPSVSFTRLVIGECAGGTGDGTTGFAEGWDPELADELVSAWVKRGYMSGALLDVDELVQSIHSVLDAGPSVSIPSVTLAPRFTVHCQNI